jgi:hypothetical protein
MPCPRLVLSAALVLTLTIAGCCLPNGGLGDRREAFNGKLVKGTRPTAAAVAGTYDLVCFGNPTESKALPRVEVELLQDGT